MALHTLLGIFAGPTHSQLFFSRDQHIVSLFRKHFKYVTWSDDLHAVDTPVQHLQCRSVRRPRKIMTNSTTGETTNSRRCYNTRRQHLNYTQFRSQYNFVNCCGVLSATLDRIIKSLEFANVVLRLLTLWT